MDFDWVTEELLRRGVLPSALLVGVVHLMRSPFEERRPWPIGGVALVGMTALATAGEVTDGAVWAGAALAGVASAVGSRLWRGAHLLLVLPGVAIATATAPEVVWWMRVIVVVGTCVAGVGADRLHRNSGHSAVYVMVLGSVAAVWLTVPEADLYSRVMAVAVVLVATAWPRSHLCLGTGGGAAAFAMIAPFVAEFGATRGGAVVGGALAGGVLFAGLLNVRLVDAANGRWGRSVYLATGLHAVVVFLVVRVAGLRSSAVAALLLAVAIHGTCLWALRRGRLLEEVAPAR